MGHIDEHCAVIRAAIEDDVRLAGRDTPNHTGIVRRAVANGLPLQNLSASRCKCLLEFVCKTAAIRCAIVNEDRALHLQFLSRIAPQALTQCVVVRNNPECGCQALPGVARACGRRRYLNNSRPRIHRGCWDGGTGVEMSNYCNDASPDELLSG